MDESDLAQLNVEARPRGSVVYELSGVGELYDELVPDDNERYTEQRMAKSVANHLFRKHYPLIDSKGTVVAEKQAKGLAAEWTVSVTFQASASRRGCNPFDDK